ncbi:hypothetical protein QUB75_27125 [Microcoleus sp. K1-B6]|uniref:hypothetical protein n=1 Tax=unclassified Microcoleus TaxID=2642155 RepID=UPI002FD620FC
MKFNKLLTNSIVIKGGMVTVEQILQSLEEIREKLENIRCSGTYENLVEHPEYIVEDFSLTDSIQGVAEALEMIPYVSELIKNG